MLRQTYPEIVGKNDMIQVKLRQVDITLATQAYVSEMKLP